MQELPNLHVSTLPAPACCNRRLDPHLVTEGTEERPENLQSCNPHKIYSTYILMMKRSIVDPDASDIRQTPHAATDMFYLLSVEISRTQVTPLQVTQ